MSKFLSAEEFERSLKEYLMERVVSENRDLSELRNEIAYERFLARMDPEHMTVKGGYAVKTQVPNSPHTKDIDLIIQYQQLPSDKRQLPRAVRDIVNERLEQSRLNDHFRFDTGEALGFSDLEPREAAARISVRAYIGASKERFTTFPLDVAVMDLQVLPPNMVTAPSCLSWAEIEPAQLSVVPPEHLFADKLLIYVESLNRNRIADLAHMALLAEQGLDLEKVATALNQFAVDRGLSSQILEPLPLPPEEWSVTFNKIMPKTKKIPLGKAFEFINDVHAQILKCRLLVQNYSEGGSI